MSNKRFHILGLAHLPTRLGERACAFTQKIVKLCKMLKLSEHEIIFYGNEDSVVDCSEFVPVMDRQTRITAYGSDKSWNNQTFNFRPDDLAYCTFNINAIKEINKRKRINDFLLIPFGFFQKTIADAVSMPLTVESGIGYPGTFAKYRVFESYAWMHYLYGKENLQDGNFYDSVIPNYFNPEDFEYCDKKDNYILYLGRIIHRKGIIIAKQIADATGTKLIVAGPLSEDVDLKSPNVEYIGYADALTRRNLLKNAKALLVPTLYIGPFEGVSIEAAFCGTPTITTDWGAFPENVIHGKTGFRCRTLEQFVWALKNIEKIKPIDCYSWANSNFTIDRISKMYNEYFDQVYGLLNGGWNTLNDDRDNLDWLNKNYV